jgi:hypothetical protein
MGQRRETRKDITVPVRIFGTDANGRPFSENVTTINVSRDGVKLSGVKALLKPGETIGLVFGTNKARFHVRWVGEDNTASAGQIGLQSAPSERSIWDFPLPAPGFDEFGRRSKGTDRRKNPRLKCMNSVELYPEGESAKVWGKASDLSLGGCFVEMPTPLRVGTVLKMILWIKDEKLQVKAKVVNSRPGFGIGIEFQEMPPDGTARLREFLSSITRIPI